MASLRDTGIVGRRLLRPIGTLLLVVTLVQAAAAQSDPGTPDSLFCDSVSIPMDSAITLPVSFTNDFPLIALEVTLRTDSSIVRIDSISFDNSRLNTAGSKGWLVDDSSRAISVFWVSTGPTSQITPGLGPLGLLHFTALGNVENLIVTVDTFTIDDGESTRSTTFILDTIDIYAPQFQQGILHFEGPCCVGLRGNVDGDPDDIVDLGDILLLAESTFLGGPPLECIEEADVERPGEGIIDLGDLLVLAAATFLGGGPLPPCP